VPLVLLLRCDEVGANNQGVMESPTSKPGGRQPTFAPPSGTTSVALACSTSPMPVSWNCMSLRIAERSLVLTAVFRMAKNPDLVAGSRFMRALCAKLS